MSLDPRVSGAAAALLWVLFCLRWFDVAALLRPAWLAVPPALLALAGAAFLAAWLRARWAELRGPRLAGPRHGMLLVVALAVLFRLPLALWGAEGYTTADAALSGIMAVHLREGSAHPVFVPSVAYSGSLKSHLTAALTTLTGLDTVRAFPLASIVFYALFVAAAYRLGLLVARPGREAPTALGAGLWAAFSPTFVTWYSLSNDGNYVEVLALGAWALVLACHYLTAGAGERASLALAAGLLLGLGFWSHILAVTHGLTMAVVVAAVSGIALPRMLGRLGLGFALGNLPALLWNALNGWASFTYLLPSEYWDVVKRAEPAGAGNAGPAFAERVRLLIVDHAPVLFGYDAGYPAALDALSWGLAALGAAAAGVGVVAAVIAVARDRRVSPVAVLLLFVMSNTGAALVALPHIRGNPRYLLFLFAALAPLTARILDTGRRRQLLVVLVAFGALGSLGQAWVKYAEARAWRGFVAMLETQGVRYCYSDYFLSSRVSFFTEERVTCSSKLGPTTIEYFLDYRTRVDRAPEPPAIVAVNRVSADRIERRLRSLGVAHERLDGMKPVFLRLSRRVDPKEIFPGREFRPR